MGLRRRSQSFALALWGLFDLGAAALGDGVGCRCSLCAVTATLITVLYLGGLARLDHFLDICDRGVVAVVFGAQETGLLAQPFGNFAQLLCDDVYRGWALLRAQPIHLGELRLRFI